MTAKKKDPLTDALQNYQITGITKEETQRAVREIYLAYLTYTGTISERRYKMNTFFLSMQTGSFILLGYILSKDAALELVSLKYVIPSLGIIIGFYWSRMISAHKQLMTGKFSVLQRMERLLPVAPFTAEWLALGEGKNPKVYRPVTDMERRIPWVFTLAHILLLAYWAFLVIESQ